MLAVVSNQTCPRRPEIGRCELTTHRWHLLIADCSSCSFTLAQLQVIDPTAVLAFATCPAHRTPTRFVPVHAWDHKPTEDEWRREWALHLERNRTAATHGDDGTSG